MAFNGSGVFNRLHNWAQDKANAIKIRADRMDAEMDGFATGLSNVICRDGQSTITADIPMNARKLTGLAAGSANGDSVRYEQISERLAAEVTVASAATCNILAAASERVAISGTTTITSLGSGANKIRFVRFSGALTLTHDATTLILPGGANITTAAGDTMVVVSDASSNARVVSYQRSSGELLTPGTDGFKLEANGIGSQPLWVDGKIFLGCTRITASGTYVTPNGAALLLVRAVGGGGGGGAANVQFSDPGGGGGGGAGAYGEKFIGNPAASYSVAVGVAGSGGVAPSTAATNGGSTSFGSELDLGGGQRALPGNTQNFATGGEGGSVTVGGDRSHAGQPGGHGNSTVVPRVAAGSGGCSPFGAGGYGYSDNSETESRDGGDASGYGAGGGGAISSSSTQRNGGDGAPGYVEVWAWR